MDDDQLRALVRDAVARHLGLPHAGAVAGVGGPGVSGSGVSGPGVSGSIGGSVASTHAAGHAHAVPLTVRTHISHARYALRSGGDEAGPCLIEPSVACNHCGYCQSHGH